MALDLFCQPYLARLLLRSQPGAGGAQRVSATLSLLFTSRSASAVWTFNCTRRESLEKCVPSPLPIHSLSFCMLGNTTSSYLLYQQPWLPEVLAQHLTQKHLFPAVLAPVSRCSRETHLRCLQCGLQPKELSRELKPAVLTLQLCQDTN